MNKALLKSAMAKYGDTQETLSKAMGLSLSRFNAKVNERKDAAFNQTEMSFIVSRYQLTNDEAMFFAK